jgi:large subunit ribosomal protein L20
MPRIRKGAARHQKHKRVLKSVRGQRGAPSKRYRLAIQSALRAGQFAYRDRKARKRDFRSLWITRISAACRQREIRYSEFINGLKQAQIGLNRKMLSEIAVADPGAFDKLVDAARGAK